MTDQTTSRPICPSCGAEVPSDAPRGYCLKCLLALGTAEPDSLADEVREQKAADDTPPDSSVRLLTSDFRSLATAPLPARRRVGGPGLQFGDYELLEEIARGGMGVVYKARQKSLGRIVAVKMLLFGQQSGKVLAQRFRAEAALAASLQHPNIVAIHEVSAHEGQPFFVMDFVEGQNLARLNANCPVRNVDWLRRAALYVKITTEAIHYAHERGILHRDLKPSNVLIDTFDQPRVTDFGLAKRLHHDSELTLSGQVLGSPNYMPPEQAAAKRGQVGRRSDVYSLGAILYHLLTGRPPFVGETLTETLHEVLNTEPVSPRLLNPSVPRDLETLCLKCLEKEPARRYQTALALAADLDRFLRDESIQARPVSSAEKVWRWCRRKPLVASLGAATLVLLLAVAIGSPVAIYRINRERERAEKGELAAREGERDARQKAYASDMTSAHQALADKDLGRALELLNRHRPKEVESRSGLKVGTLAKDNDKGASSSSLALNSQLTPLSTDLRGWEWRYLWQGCLGEERFILGEHTNRVTAIGLLPDGRTVFSAGRDRWVRLWDLESRRQVGLLPHAEEVVGAAASPDGRWLATATSKYGEGHPLLLWDLATHPIATTLATNFWLRPGSITFSPDGHWLAFVAQFGGVRLWDLQTRTEMTNLDAFSSSVAPIGLAFSPDSRTLAYNEDEHGAIRLWDIARRALTRLAGHHDIVTALAFSPDGQWLASGSQDRTARLWRLAPGVRPSLGAATNAEPPAQKLSPAHDDGELAAARDDRLPTEWREKFQLTNHTSGSARLAFSPDSRTLALVGARPVIHLVDVQTGSQIGERRGHRKSVTGLAFTPDGQTLLSASDDGTLRVWDVAPPAKEMPARPFARNSISTEWRSYGPALFLAPDARHLITVYTDQTFSVWDTLRLAEGEQHPLPFTNTMFAAVAPGGRVAAFSSQSGAVTLWHPETGQAQFFAQPGTNRIHRLVFSLDGRFLAAADDSKPPSAMAAGDDLRRTIRVWDVDARKETHTFSIVGGFPISLTFSADARALLAGFWKGSVTLWPLDGPGEAATFPGHPRHAGGVALLPDGQTLISVGQDICVWDVRTRREIDRLNPRTGAYGLALSPDGRRFATATGDGSVSIWDAISHEEVATLEGHQEEVMQLAFTPDGDHLVSVSKDQLRVWRVPSWAEIEAAEKGAGK